MTKQAYVKALMQQSAKWVFASAKAPNSHMTSMDIKLHYVALRRMRAL